jgi:hypothetical protein
LKKWNGKKFLQSLGYCFCLHFESPFVSYCLVKPNSVSGVEQGQIQQFKYILEEGTSADVEEYFGKKAEFERIQALCALAAYFMQLGRFEGDRTKKNEEYQKALSFLHAARTINVEEQLPHIGLGQLSLAKACRVSLSRSDVP